MIIAAITSQSLSLDKLPINWFDATVVAVLAFGIFRGRKNGMTKEVLPAIEWIVLVIAAGLAYGFLAPYYARNCAMGRLAGAIFAYLSIAVIVYLVFSFIGKALTPRLTGSNIFGGAEYYLGMSAGMIRYACILIFFLALIDARHYSGGEIAAAKAYRERWYGGGIYSGDYVPDLHTVQESIFKKSFTGPYIHDYLGMLLINTTPDGPAGKSAAQKPQPVIHMGN